MSEYNLRILSVVFLSLLGSATATGQGTLYFGNRLSTIVFARVYAVGPTLASGPGYSAQLYAGTNGTELHAVGTPLPFRTGLAAGSWYLQEVTIPWASPGDVVTLQVRAWDNYNGAFLSFESACTAGAATGRSLYFASLPLGGGSPPVFPPLIIGNPQSVNNLQEFYLYFTEFWRCGDISWQPWTPWFWNPILQTNGSYVFKVSAAQPGTCVVESSTNLVTWTPILTNAGPAITVSFTDTNAAASSAQKFYRARIY